MYVRYAEFCPHLTIFLNGQFCGDRSIKSNTLKVSSLPSITVFLLKKHTIVDNKYTIAYIQ